MRILVTGGRGFIGRVLTHELLSGRHGLPDVTEVVVLDVAPGPGAAETRVRHVVGDATEAALLAETCATPFDLVFALGATLTQDAERDFDLGLAVNVQGFLRLIEACRRQAAAPRLVFTSSIAAFGGPLPETVEDDWPRTPQTSYGTHKAIVELLLADATRRGFIDGRALRLPIVLTRPGPPVASVSDRVATLIRDPLRGHDVVFPLAPETIVPLASVQSVARALIGLAAVPAHALTPVRAMNLPSLSARVGELAAAVASTPQRRAWQRPIGTVTFAPDPTLQAIVATWPRRFESARARALGIAGSPTLATLVDDFIDNAAWGAA